MKVKVDINGVYLEYEISRGEHKSFLEQLAKYRKRRMRITYFDGENTENSWIKAKEWIH